MLLVGPDGAFHHYPLLKDSLGPNGVLAFHFGQGGGAPMHPAIGSIPLERLLLGLGMGLQGAINYTLMISQMLATYFALAFVGTWRRWFWSDYLIAPLLIGFSPALMTRFSAGHVNFILSYMACPALLFILSSLWRKKRIGTLNFGLLAFGFAQALSYVGYQTLFYSLLLLLPLGIPVVLSSLRDPSRRWELVVFVGCLATATLAFCWCEVRSILDFFSSGELARNVKDTHAVFQYLLPDWTTWSGSVFESTETIPDAVSAALHHEIAFPAFGLLSAFGILYWRNTARKKILLGLLIPALILFIFSFNPPGFAPLLLKLIPGLGAFRVITRFMIPLLTLLGCLVLVVYRSKEKVSPREFILFTGGAILTCVGSLMNSNVSVAFELCSAGLLILGIKKIRVQHLAMGMLVGGSIFGAIERKGDFISYNFDPKVKSEIKDGSKSVLERSEYFIPGTPTNVGMFTGAYSLSFYLNSQKSFSELLGAFTGVNETYRMTADFSSPNAPSFFKALFNSVHEIRMEDQKLVSKRVRDSHPVRIPIKTARMNSSEVAALAQDRTRGMDYILNVLDSPEAPQHLPDNCKSLKYRIERADLEEIRFGLEGNTEGCFAVLPINPSQLIEVTGNTDSGATQSLRTLKSNQTLTGIELKPGIKSVVLRPRIFLNSKQLGAQVILGLFFIGIWATYSRRRRKSAEV